MPAMSNNILKCFLITAHENEAECLEKYSTMISHLEKISINLRDMSGLNLTSSLPKEGGVFETLLLANAYSLFLSAVRIALSGQSPPVFAVLRACLESALYAVIAAQSPINRKIWLDQSKGVSTCRNLFKKGKAKEYLEKSDLHLSNFVTQLYDSLIDFGAHPNSRSILNHLSFETRYERQAVTLAILHNPDSRSVLGTLAACFETGVCVLYLAHHALPQYPPARAAHSHATDLHREFRDFLRLLDAAEGTS
ncbi:MAG: hypothetical protein ACREE4_13395 [Stellaceae bacterium]